ARAANLLFGRHAAARRATGQQQNVGAVEPEDVGRAEMPEILADENAHAAETGVERPHLLAPGEFAPLVKHTIGRQVDFAVDVQYLAPREVGGADVELLAPVHLYEPYDDVHIAAGVEQPGEDRLFIGGRQGHVESDVAQPVAGQRQLWKDEQLDALRGSILNGGEVQLEISLYIAKTRVNLCQADSQVHLVPLFILTQTATSCRRR